MSQSDDAKLANAFFQHLASSPGLERFAPSAPDRLKRAEEQGRHFRDVLDGEGAPSKAHQSGDALARRGAPLSVAVRAAQHHLMAELAAQVAAPDGTKAAMMRAVSHVFDELAFTADGYLDGQQQRRDRICDFDHATADLHGHDWFHAMVKHLQSETQADFLFVGELIDEGTAVSMLALASQDDAAEPFIYALQGTPCAEVLAGVPCVFSHRVAQQFPEDHLLEELEIEGYLGMPLFGGEKVPIGLLVALFRRPVIEFEFWLDVLERFSRRASSVLLRQRYQAELHRERAEFEAMLSSLPDPAMMHQDGRLVWVNERMVQLTGYERSEQLVGLRLLDLLAPADHSVAMDRISQMSVSGEPAPAREFRILRADNSLLHVEMVATPIQRDGQQAFVAVGRDLMARRQLQQRARHMDRLSLLGSLSGGLSHEVNNPLTFMLANLGFAAEELQALCDAAEEGATPASVANAAKSIRAYLDDVTIGCRRIGIAVHTVHGLVKPESLQSTTVSLGQALDVAIGSVAALKDGSIEFVYEHTASVAVMADSETLSIAIHHILLNAVDALTADKLLTTSERRPWIRLQTILSGAEAIVVVEDNGPGIAPQVGRTLFEPFMTTKMRSLRAGLGLSIARDTIERIGGTITAENRPENGARFTLSLPVAPAATSQD